MQKPPVAEAFFVSAPGKVEYCCLTKDRPMSDLILPRFDGALVNAATGANVQGRDKSLGYSIGNLTILEKEFVETLYAESFECQRVVDTLPEEMTREWIELTIDKGKGDIVGHAMAYQARLNLAEHFRNALTQAYLYGGAIAVLYIDDGQTPDKPVDLKSIKTIEGLSTLDRWQLATYGGTLEDPEFYQILYSPSIKLYDANGQLMQAKPRKTADWSGRIHKSRVLRFDGDWAPFNVRQYNQGWGLSKLQRFLKPFMDYFSVYQALGAMIQDASLFVYKIRDLMSIIEGGNQNLLRERLRENWLAASVYGAMIMDAERENGSFIDRNFAGLDQMADRFERRLVAGSDGLPHSYVLGRSGPNGGLDGSGEAEEKHMAKLVKRRQEKCFRKHLEYCFKLIFAAKDFPGHTTTEAIQFEINFKPLYLPTAQEIAELKATVIQTDATAIASGIYTAEEAAISHFSTANFNPEITIDWKKRNQQTEAARQQEIEAAAIALLEGNIGETEEMQTDSTDSAEDKAPINRLMPPPIAVQKLAKQALSQKQRRLPIKDQWALQIARLISAGKVPSLSQINQAIGWFAKGKEDDLVYQLLGGKLGLKWWKATRSHVLALEQRAGRVDAVRSSCSDCLLKHLGSSLVLMDEAENGYPEHALLAIGHLAQAEEESREFPGVSDRIRQVRKQYQATGITPDFRELIEILREAGLWHADAQTFFSHRREDRLSNQCGKGWQGIKGNCKRAKALHTASHLAENVVSWAVGRAVGGAIANMAASHGLDPFIAKVAAEASVQALTATAIYARKKENRKAGELARKFIAEVSGAAAGKLMHHEAEQILERGDAYVRTLAAIASGKLSGATVTTTVTKIVKRGEQALNRLLAADWSADSDRNATARTVVQLEEMDKKALFDLALLGILLRQRRNLLEEKSDRAGQGKPCGRGFISVRKKCSSEKAKQLAADLKAGDKSAKARVARGKELAAERQRLRKAVERDKGKKAVVIKPDAKGFKLANQIAKEAKNNIVPANLSARRSLLSQIKGQQLELKRLAAAANEAIELQKKIEEARKNAPKPSKAKKLLDDLTNQKKETLERIYKGKIDRDEARLAALYKRIYENMHPRRQVKMPKGATQREFRDAMMAIAAQDKQAIAKYTAPRPPKKKKAAKKPAAQRKPKPTNKNKDQYQ